MQARQKRLLLDIDGTIINSVQTILDNKIVWYGGSPAIWATCLGILKEASIEIGLASYKTEKDYIAEVVEWSLAKFLSPEHLYYDLKGSANKNHFALSQAAKTLEADSDVCLLDDQDVAIMEALKGGYGAVKMYDFTQLHQKKNAALREQLAIVLAFEIVIEELQLPALPKLSQLRREISILIAASENRIDCLRAVLEEKPGTTHLSVKTLEGLDALTLTKQQNYKECEALLVGHYEHPQPAFAPTLFKRSSPRFFDNHEAKEDMADHKEPADLFKKRTRALPTLAQQSTLMYKAQRLSFAEETNREKAAQAHQNQPKGCRTKATCQPK